MKRYNVELFVILFIWLIYILLLCKLVWIESLYIVDYFCFVLIIYFFRKDLDKKCNKLIKLCFIFVKRSKSGKFGDMF